MVPHPEEKIDSLLAQLRNQSPLPLLMSLLVSTFLLTLAINFFSSAAYDLLVHSLSLNQTATAYASVMSHLSLLTIRFVLSPTILNMESKHDP